MIVCYTLTDRQDKMIERSVQRNGMVTIFRDRMSLREGLEDAGRERMKLSVSLYLPLLLVSYQSASGLPHTLNIT